MRTREDRLDLFERELKNCNPDHWLVADEEDSNEEEEDPEPESKQLEFDFGPDDRDWETIF